MPAAAVIPAPMAYTNFAAVKTLVVEIMHNSVVSFRTTAMFVGWMPPLRACFYAGETLLSPCLEQIRVLKPNHVILNE